MNWKMAWKTVSTSVKQFFEDDATTLAAALSFYTSLSLAPLLLIQLWLAGLAGPETQERVVEGIVGLIGPEAGAAVEIVVKNAREQPSLGSIAGVIGMITLALGASGVFAQLQTALNHIWRVTPRRGKVLTWLRKRTLSMGMLLAIGFLLLVSLALNTMLALLGDRVKGLFPLSEYFWLVLNSVVSMALVAVLFAAIFKVLPDVYITWRDVWFGAITTAFLFTVGKLLIGIYLGRSSVGSAYGAAGALVVLLVWVYFSALIFLFGGELTEVRATLFGSGARREALTGRIEPRPAEEESRKGRSSA